MMPPDCMSFLIRGLEKFFKGK